MLLNGLEKTLMNNPVRAAMQRHWDTRIFLKLGGSLCGGAALEIGCGRGVGAQIILRDFGAEHVDAFDLDPDMIRKARHRLQHQQHRVRLWIGDVTRIDAADESYDAVFDFGVIHHVPDWRVAIAEIARVLKPEGRLYAEEPFARLVRVAWMDHVLRHPREAQFEPEVFEAALMQSHLRVVGQRRIGKLFGWYVARKTDLGCSSSA